MGSFADNDNDNDNVNVYGIVGVEKYELNALEGS